MRFAGSWRRYAHKLAAEREQFFPRSVALAKGVRGCALHGDPIGAVTRMSLRCHPEAREHTGEQFRGLL